MALKGASSNGEYMSNNENYNSTNNWNELEIRLEYIQTQVEEAQGALARKHALQTDAEDKTEAAEAAILAKEELCEKQRSGICSLDSSLEKQGNELKGTKEEFLKVMKVKGLQGYQVSSWGGNNTKRNQVYYHSNPSDINVWDKTEDKDNFIVYDHERELLEKERHDQLVHEELKEQDTTDCKYNERCPMEECLDNFPDHNNLGNFKKEDLVSKEEECKKED